ncbi:UNVERIFIED_CONTAM: hypothetical protein GTU68_006243 [Idotea baltica]|nr:hypothetical protein [Idotea baltica]
MNMITQKQRDLLEFIQKRLDRDGVPPSFDEMRIALDLKSKSGIHRLITALEERGFIRRLAHKARALEIVKLPESMENKTLRSIQTPPHGDIAAGVPIAAIEHQQYEISVPNDIISSGEHFALSVRGDSMIDAGILDGDTVIIHRQDVAQNGDIIVALVEDQEATLKRLRKKGTSIALEAANSAFETRVYRADQVRIQGKLAGLIRSYR